MSGFEVDPAALRSAAEAVDALAPGLATSGPALVGTIESVTAVNPGYLTSAALAQLASAYATAADEFGQRLSGHADGLVSSANSYEQADQSLRGFGSS